MRNLQLYFFKFKRCTQPLKTNTIIPKQIVKRYRIKSIKKELKIFPKYKANLP